MEIGMAYKKLHIIGGHLLVGCNLDDKISHDEIEVTSTRVMFFEDEDGRIIPYDHPRFRYDLRCDLSFGCAHIIALADENRIVEFLTGEDADGNGIYWSVEQLQYTYGRDSYLNNLFNSMYG